MIIYKTTNLVNNKIYIGQDRNNNPKYIGSGLLLTQAIKKYGENSFRKEILEHCTTKEELNIREKYWIKYYNSIDKNVGYNISEGGTGGKLTPVEGKKGKTYEEYYGIERATEIKKTLSQIRAGKKLGYKNITSQEVGKKISNALKNKKIKLTDGQKENLSNKLKDFYKTDEGIKQKENLRILRTNSKLSEETKAKQSAALKGKRPKIMDVHSTAQYWYFYDKDNNLICETLGNRTKKLKELGTNQRRIIIFTDLDECLKYTLEKNKHYKIYTKKYYN